MNTDLKRFARLWLGVVAMSLLPVLLTAFVSIPLSLGHYPGDGMAAARIAQGDRHMT